MLELGGDTHGRVLTMRGDRASPCTLHLHHLLILVLVSQFNAVSRIHLPYQDLNQALLLMLMMLILCVRFSSFIVSIVISSSHWTAAFRPILTVQLTVAGRQQQDSTCGHSRQITGLGVSTILGMGPFLTALWATKRQDAEES